MTYLTDDEPRDHDPEARVERFLSRDLERAVRKGMTAEEAARACYAVLREAAEVCGQKPDIEVMIRAPGEARHFDDCRSWVVAWEAGPHEWAIPASFRLCDATGALVEPHYSFDLTFYPSEFEGRKRA